MLGIIKPLIFSLFADSKPHDNIRALENDPADHKGIATNHPDSDELRNEQSAITRQQAVDSFVALGTGVIIAESFGAIYERNAINSAMPQSAISV